MENNINGGKYITTSLCYEMNHRNKMKHYQSRQIDRHGTRFDIGLINIKC